MLETLLNSILQQYLKLYYRSFSKFKGIFDHIVEGTELIFTRV